MARRIIPRPSFNNDSSQGVHIPNASPVTYEHQYARTIVPQVQSGTVPNHFLSSHPVSTHHMVHLPTISPPFVHAQYVQPHQSDESNVRAQQIVQPTTHNISTPNVFQTSIREGRQGNEGNTMNGLNIPAQQIAQPAANHHIATPNALQISIRGSRQGNENSNRNSGSADNYQETRNHEITPGSHLAQELAQEDPMSNRILQQQLNTGQAGNSPPQATPNSTEIQPSNTVRLPVHQNGNRTGSASGRGRLSSRQRGSRKSRKKTGRAKNLLPNLERSAEQEPDFSSSPSSNTQVSTQLLAIHELLRANFHQQTEMMRKFHNSAYESNSARNNNETGRSNNIASNNDALHDSMTKLSNGLCLTFQLFIVSAFVGKAPLWYLFPSNEKESELFELCAGFFKENSNTSILSLDQEKVTVNEFLQGDTIYGRQGVQTWKHKGRIVRSGAKKEVYSLSHRLKRLRSRVHDEMTRIALKCFFSHVSEFHSLRLGVQYSFLTSASCRNALQYCQDKQNLGIDPLTDGTWKEAYLQTNQIVMEHAKSKMKQIYRKLESLLSSNQVTAIASYFKNFHYQRYQRNLPLLNFDSRPSIPAILEAYISTKVRCRLSDIASFEANERGISHQQFFEVSPCESHFIPLLGDLIKITQKQGSGALSTKMAYGCKCERITDEEFTWAKQQYERMIHASSDLNSCPPDVGLNLLSSLVDTVLTNSTPSPNDPQQTNEPSSSNYQNPSPSDSSNSILNQLRTSSLVTNRNEHTDTPS